MSKEGKQSYYEILDVSLSAKPDAIRTAYVRAKNSYNRDSLAAYSLFDKDESKKILDEIEEAYSVLSDLEKRRKYDESHGIVTSESVYESYHRGNQVVAAFARDTKIFDQDSNDFQFEEDPFRKIETPRNVPPPVAPRNPADFPAAISAKIAQEMQKPMFAPKPVPAEPAFALNEEMEEKIKKLENVTGAFFREVREYKRVKPETVVDNLKISKNYLMALEEDNISKLPANVFVRGFVIHYAKLLKLDPDKTTNSYMAFLKSKRPS